MLSLIVTTVLYALVILVTIGISNPENLKETITPISDGGYVFGGNVFKIVISVGAFLAFISTANSAIMTASRYPLGMSRDKLLPGSFQKISTRFKTPYIAILFTGFFIIVVILFLRLELLVKVASSILIILYIFANLTLILFRESKILSYRPKFHVPFYPYLPVLGIVGGVFLLIEIGTFTLLLTLFFLLLGFIWYKAYAEKRATQHSALIHVLERLVAKDKELTSESLLTELRDIVIQRDKIVEDKFHKLIEEGRVLDIDPPLKMESFFRKISDILSEDLNIKSEELFNKFLKREIESSTVVGKGLAIPHIAIKGENIFKVILIRAKAGIIFPRDQLVHILFVFVGSSGDRILHLKVLSAIAQVIQSPRFTEAWNNAKNEEELRNVVLLADRQRS